MIDQTQTTVAQPTDDLAQATAFTKQPNPASVYDEVDNLTLKPEEMALMGALTQTQADVAEESANTLAEIQAVIADGATAQTKTK